MVVDDMSLAAAATVPAPLSMSEMKTRWRAHCAGVAWPTVLFMGSIVAAEIVLWTVVLNGTLAVGWAMPIAVGLAYASFTVMHEASHGNVAGRDRRAARIEQLLGWTSGFVLFAPYPVFRMLHLRHHSHTNDPHEDPDYWVASSSFLGVVARCWTIMPRQYADFLFGSLGRTNAGRKVWGSGMIGITFIVTLMAVLFSIGLGREALLLWFVPAWIATGFLAFAFDWLPHHPHTVRERFKDTRVVLFPGAELLLLWQNYHLVHHLYPRIPFYRYGKVFGEIRPYLESKGAPIDDWRP